MSARNQAIRHECLMQLYGAMRLGTSAAAVRRTCQRNRDDFTAPEIADALFFLASQGLAQASTDPATGERRYTITGAGVTEWEQNH